MMTTHRPTALIILDGWGYSEQKMGNAIALANTPVWDKLWANAPHTLISGSGLDVGLPQGQMGNSEVGHLNMGAGRPVLQDLVRINLAIQTKEFAQNKLLNDTVQTAMDKNAAVHILGLLSDGGVHSHEDHIHAMVELAVKKGAKKVYVHAFLDGRDTAPKSAMTFIERLNEVFDNVGGGKLVSLCGRYYAMDRDQRLERTQLAFELLTKGIAEHQASTAIEGLELAYSRGENDEFVKPTLIHDLDHKPVTIEKEDSIIFMNFRSDRARQITHSFLNHGFENFMTLTKYASDITYPYVFGPDNLDNTLGEYISDLGLKQLRIAETEKYAHVTFFFNGGRELIFLGEDRILVPSPKVATYDLQPEMSAPELTDKLVEAIKSGKYDMIICNYANADMVGHSGILSAAIQAIEAIDECLGRIIEALHSVGGEALITADHGNVEEMFDENGEPRTSHTTNPVPLIYVGRTATPVEVMHPTLTDIAPTILNIMGLDKPVEMTGRALFDVK
jgi:2,3-bisphosphoglycerate-independent phosphoglycerate mutase